MTDPNATDEQLLLAFVKGDRAALGELARRYESPLLGLAHGLLGGRSSVACDAVQEAWMRVIPHGTSFNNRSSFKTWLYRITINRCRDLGARQGIPQPDGPLAMVPAGDGDPVQGTMIKERNDVLHTAVNTLAPPKREVVLLCYHDGMTHQQAAEILEIPLGTLKSRLHAALQELRQRLPAQPAPLDQLPSAERHVVRKATIELVTDDVGAVFLKVAQLISQAKGEYIESSSLAGSGKDARADLTLRVAADRLHEVLNDLRQLATVRSEESHGEDVTTQVVDLQSRLRNEQRIEAELLELLQKREDASLEDILELRRRINEVRGSIERLIAQQQRIDRLVGLATVLVIIRPQDAPQEEPQAGLGQYFSESIGASWSGGLRFLADTIALGLRVVIGGLVWWLVLVAAFLAIRHSRREVQQPRAM